MNILWRIILVLFIVIIAKFFGWYVSQQEKDVDEAIIGNINTSAWECGTILVLDNGYLRMAMPSDFCCDTLGIVVRSDSLGEISVKYVK